MNSTQRKYVFCETPAEAPSFEVDGNLSPEYLSNARERVSAEVVAMEQYHITRPYYTRRPDITTSGQEVPTCKEFTQPRNHPDAELVQVLNAGVLLAQLKKSRFLESKTMTCATLCCGSTQFARLTIKVFRERFLMLTRYLRPAPLGAE